jgi:CheY-like chemotaxis protein
LIVDDSEINLGVAEHILVGEGATIALAENGEIALQMLLAQPDKFDIVLMDMQMPVMDGYEATRQVRLLPALSALPVIALTAGAFTEQRKRAEDAGVNDFVAKPFEVNDLIRIILKHTRFSGAVSLVAVAPAPPPLPAPSLMVLNQERALQLWGDLATYAKYLHKFLNAHENTVTAIISAELENASQLAHKLKGAAAQLNIEQVAALAASAENALEDGEKPMPILAQLQTAMDQVKIAILELAPVPIAPEPAVMQHTADTAALSANLAQLLELMPRQEPAAVEAAIEALSGSLPNDSLQRIRQAVAAYEFRLAEEIVSQIVITLELSNK